MRINEVVQQVNLSKRAVKYYEEQGLLEVEKIRTVTGTIQRKL